MGEVELIQNINDDLVCIKSPKIDGYSLMTLKDHMLADQSTSERSVNHIFSNAYKIFP